MLRNSEDNDWEVNVVEDNSSMNIDYSSFNEDQIEEIEMGLEDNLNVVIYAKKEFDSSQMKYIRLGLKEDLDVSIYADTRFSGAQMSHIFWGLWHGLDVSIYADPKYSAGQMEELYLGVFNNIDVTPFANPKYHRDYMRSQRLQIELNTKASRINKSNEDKKKPAKRIFEDSHEGRRTNMKLNLPKIDRDELKETEDVYVLKKYASSMNPDDRRAVASNPNTPANVLKALSKDQDRLVRLTVSNNPSVSEKMSERLLDSDRKMQEKEHLASIKNTDFSHDEIRETDDVDVLIKYSKSSDSFERLLVANNPNTPIDVLAKLSKDKNPDVSSAADLAKSDKEEMLFTGR